MTPVPINPWLGINLLPTGIPGFDAISSGGSPLERLPLVSGTAGAAKTVFAAQLLVEGIRQAGETCVLVSLEESPAGDEGTLIGDYDLGGLPARIQAAIWRQTLGHRRGHCVVLPLRQPGESPLRDVPDRSSNQRHGRDVGQDQ